MSRFGELISKASFHEAMTIFNSGENRPLIISARSDEVIDKLKRISISNNYGNEELLQQLEKFRGLSLKDYNEKLDKFQELILKILSEIFPGKTFDIINL
ncbi:hypothetical protein C3I27_04365 [Campylobacter jejuni]|uniref:Uncharacterized protein n=1 Tax=Campylobacter jejuni TaxID=197 RepID=A0A430VC67_CAMJU|nr:hypothetical protein [Campylobacter jejuni]RTI48663.1 hypothetical protein C3I27_04365 [Campylobacter jejuni]RTJ78000.1 hypothetical protein C3H57_09725 [Campylobacter jejuni]HEG8091979.1 hypothetical protein [Campylobacter jejuni]HEG8094049.1 hypothetical protein [Campylobacter jejuni]HEG8098420.1 hypothetical protein [Campylobacter jejuni]